MATPKWPHDHEAKHRKAAKLGWERKRRRGGGKIGPYEREAYRFVDAREGMRGEIKRLEHIARSKKSSPQEREHARLHAPTLRWRYKQMGAYWQGGWERFANFK